MVTAIVSTRMIIGAEHMLDVHPIMSLARPSGLPALLGLTFLCEHVGQGLCPS